MLPDELNKFFDEPGRMLLVKGSAGTGKTLLGFRLLKEMSRFGDAIWVNSRDMDSADLSELERIVPTEKRLDTTKRDIKATEHKSEQSYEPPITDFEVLRSLYRELNETEKPTVVIDSFDGLTTDMQDSEKEALRIGLVRLARNTKTNLVVIMETFEPNPLDYLADGIVTLREDTVDYRRVRVIQLNKLRGTAINRPRYLFTLDGGDFRCLPPFESENIEKPNLPCPIQDFDDKISTGAVQLDAILGGYTKGSVNLFEIGTGVGDAYLSIFIPTVVNNLNLNRGWMYIPSQGRDMNIVKKFIAPFTTQGNVEKYICVPIESMHGSKPTPNLMTQNTETIEEYIAPCMLSRKRFSTKEPTLSSIGLDTLEYRYGVDNAHSAILNIVSDTKNSDNVDLLLATWGQKLVEHITQMVDSYWRIQNIHGSIVIYGIVPRTEMYGISIDTTNGFFDPKLTYLL